MKLYSGLKIIIISSSARSTLELKKMDVISIASLCLVMQAGIQGVPSWTFCVCVSHIIFDKVFEK